MKAYRDVEDKLQLISISVQEQATSSDTARPGKETRISVRAWFVSKLKLLFSVTLIRIRKR
jgi:hypothetical protein